MKILETILYAENMEAAYDFYTRILGLEEIAYNPERSIFLKCDNGVLIVFKASKTMIPDAGVPPHGTTGIGHMAFAATDAELEVWKIKLPELGVPIVQEIVWQNGAISIYFRDPGGNVLEFATPRLWGM
jgi:catechol 2,3-dioxygenase-like lactoylglutathione lyase family enzyme